MKSTSILIIFLIIIGSIPFFIGDSRSIQSRGLSIYGRVTEESSGLPIKGAEIYTYNSSRGHFLYGITDENGEYTIQVGLNGKYSVGTWHRNFLYNNTKVYLDNFDSKRVDFTMKKYEFNAMGHIYCNLGGPVNYNNVTGIFKNSDGNGTDYLFQLEDGNDINLNMEPGIYTPFISKPGFIVTSDPIEIDSENITHFQIIISPLDANWNSPNIFVNDMVVIPPRSYAVFTFNVTELCNLYLSVKSNEIVHVFSSTHEMYLNYLDWDFKGNFDFERDWKYNLYDFSMEGRGIGMSVVAWEDPYHIIIENNNPDSATTYLTLKYEHAEVESRGFGFHPLNEDVKEEDNADISSYLILGSLLILIIIFLVSVKKHRSRQEKMISL